MWVEDAAQRGLHVKQRACEGGGYSDAEKAAAHELPAGNAPLTSDPATINEIIDCELSACFPT